MNQYIQGQVADSTATFPGDPTTVVYSYWPAGNTAATVTITYTGASSPAVGVVARLSAGVYMAKVDTTHLATGVYIEQWQSTGAFQTVGQSSWAVIPQGSVPSIGGIPVVVSDLISATRDHLQGTYRSEWNTLSQTCQATDTTISLSGPIGGTSRTAYLSIDDEILYVQTSNASPAQAQVLRGFDGTIPASHQAGALIEVSPRFPAHMIRRQLAMEIASWPENLFQVATQSFTLSNDGKTFAYDFGVPSSQVLYLLDVRHAPWSSTNRNTWPAFSIPPKLNRAVDPATFPSGLAIEIPATSTGGTYELVGAVECVAIYGTPFNLASMADTVLVGPGGLGLAPSMIDIAALGAAYRLIGPREALRTFGEAMDQQRPTQDVPAGAAMKIAIWLKTIRDQRIAEEIEHLNVAWPMRAK